MNTLTAFQGTTVAFTVVLSPEEVDFDSGDVLVADVHRGDGRAPVLTVTPTWTSVATDTLSVLLDGDDLADLTPGGYFLSVRLADESAYLSYDILNLMAGTGGTHPLRSLITPSEAVQLLPDLIPNLPQFTALPNLLTTATELIEKECERKFILANFTGTWPCPRWGSAAYIDLEYPVVTITSVSLGPAGWPVDSSDFTAIDEWDLEPQTGQLRVEPTTGISYSSNGPSGRLIRVVYRAGYAVEQADLDLGRESVPGPLRKACAMVARTLQEQALTAGPIKTQTVRDRSYTKTESPMAVIDEVMPYIGRYKRQWVVA
jgi:hypothetical protein